MLKRKGVCKTGRSALTATLAIAGALFAAAATAADGKMIYRQVCAACHATGVAGAPRLGNPADWAQRLVAGRATLMVSVLKGKGQMPPKGGNVSLSDEDARAALDYMLGQAK